MPEEKKCKVCGSTESKRWIERQNIAGIKDKGENPQRTSEQSQHVAELSRLVGGSVVNEIKGDPSKATPDGLKESFYKHYELWTDLNNGELGKVRLLRTAQ